MTETEKLKKDTQEQFIQERKEELIEHLKMIVVTIQVLDRRGRRSTLFEVICVILLIITAVMSATFLWTITFALFMFTMVNRVYTIDLPRAYAMGEFDGVIKALEILRITDVDNSSDKGKKKRTKKKVSLFEKMWKAIKSKKRKEAFA